LGFGTGVDLAIRTSALEGSLEKQRVIEEGICDNYTERTERLKVPDGHGRQLGVPNVGAKVPG